MSNKSNTDIPINYKTKTAGEGDIYSHLMECNDTFVSQLAKRINIKEYSTKLFEKTVTFEAWLDNRVIGLVSAYFNDANNAKAYITDVSVKEKYNQMGIASNLMNMCIEYAKRNNYKMVELEVHKDNVAAIKLYNRYGFVQYDSKNDNLLMRLSEI